MTPTWEWERKGVGMHVDGNLSTVPRVGIIFPFPWDFFRNGNMTPTWEWERKGVGMCVDGNPSTVCIYTIVLLCVCGNRVGMGITQWEYHGNGIKLIPRRGIVRNGN